MSKATELNQLLPDTLQRAMDLASEKGASSWLTALPLSEHGFTLHKGAFQDALALRYGRNPTNTPTNCDCGKAFSTEHALSCAKGGFPTIRHNEIRDLTADLQPETLRYVTANTRHLRYGEADLTLMLECPCPIKQRLRNMKEKNLRTESTRNWTCTFGNVYHWKDGHNLL